MKQFIADRSGLNPTLEEVPNEKVKVYDSKTDMDTDISNIAEGEIVATKAGESEGAVEVVDEVTDGVMSPVTSNAVADCLSYSTTEQPTGGKWIDGKPIYRRVVHTTITASGHTLIADPSSWNISQFTNIDVISKSSTGTQSVQYYYDTDDFMRCFIATSGKVDVEVGSNFPARPIEIWVTLEYTKTTD